VTPGDIAQGIEQKEVFKDDLGRNNFLEHWVKNFQDIFDEVESVLKKSRRCYEM